MSIIDQVSCPSLLEGTHELAHGDLNFTNGFVVTSTISINHDELVVLDLLKPVGYREASGKVWVEIVLDLLSLTNLLPRVVDLLKDDTHGIGLAKGI